MSRYGGLLYGLSVVLIIWALDALRLRPVAVGVVSALASLAIIVVWRPKEERREIRALTLWVISSVGVGLLGMFWPR
jgi:hypothetical protein